MQYCVILAFIGAPFWTLGASNVPERVLIYKSENTCAIAAYRDLDRQMYFYKDFDKFLHDNKTNDWAGNCILVQEVDKNTISHQASIPNGFKFRIVAKSKDFAFTHEMALPPDFEAMAMKNGFDKPLVVGNKTFFMKEMNFPSTYKHAMMKCLENGGILPMEKTDEFVDQMSILVGDATTSRFISLAYESTTNNAEKFLMWTTGIKEWKEGESLTECPRCQNWNFGDGIANLWAKINPTTKLYDIATPSETVPKFYCQYLGGNLAIHKKVVVSSMYTYFVHNLPGYAVDGVVCDSCNEYWHSASGTPGGEWISIDLGANYIITNVLFLARTDSFSYRHDKMQVWIDGPKPVIGTALDTSERILCAIYRFYQRDSQLSGVECQYPTLGRRVTILNPSDVEPLHFHEIVVHGLNPMFS